VIALKGPRELVLIRHAQSRGNVADAEARDRGADRLELDVRDADMPLSETGEQQATSLGAYVDSLPAQARPKLVYSSPYARAVATAKGAVERADHDVRIILDERLRERELGVLDGMTGTGIRRLYPEEAGRREWLGKFYYRPPSGESWADVVLRVRQFLLNVSLDPTPPDRLWVVSHQAVLLAFRVVMEGISEQEVLEIDRATPIPNCSLTRYAWRDDEGWCLTDFADDRTVAEAPTTAEPPAADRAVDDARS
jgi:broad specificity phosphatase PhoE